MTERDSCEKFRWRVDGRAMGRLSILVAVVLICNNGIARAQAVDARTAAHLLEQSTFGPTAADVALVQTSGYEQWLNNQFAMPESPMPDDLDVNGVRNQLFLNMANGPDQLRQRVMFALSQIIVVSANKNNDGEELIPWVRLLSSNAFVNYRTLLREVTLSPTMGKFLDLAYSRCTRAPNTCPSGSTTTSPNENYPREMLQLFSIGLWELNMDGTVKVDAAGQPIPTYTQATIAEFARAMTGWTYPTMPGATPRNSNPEYFVGEMIPRVTTHDTGAKTLLNGVVLPAGQTTEADMEGVLDTVFQHPNVPPFIATRLIRSLVTSNPSPAYIQRVATVFANNGSGVRGDLRAVITAILTDPEARSFAITDGRLKDPILHVIGMGRALGAQITNPNSFMYVFSNLSQRVLTPTTVFSFYSLLGLLPGHGDLFGPEFGIYPPALALQRANFIYSLLNGSFSSSFAISLDPYVAVAGDANALVELVNQNLMFGRMTTELRELITVATSAITGTSTGDLRQRATGALYLAAISSEYSVYSDSTVVGAAVVQPPTGLVVTRIAGNLITVNWKSPLIGPAPTGYVLEGGVRPGQVLAAIPTGSSAPTFTFAAPPGAFYIRVRTLAGGSQSRASGEIRLYVNVPAGPTAPRSLSGYGNGSSVVMRWQNTFGGGAPQGVTLDVSRNGARVMTIPLGLTETFSHNAVPPGTYSFSVRATNAAGSSGSSNSITMTFPLNGCSRPSTPAAFSTALNGRVVGAYWMAPPTGTAPAGYEVEVRINGNNNNLLTFPVAGTAISGTVAPGRYDVRVRARNICGTSNWTSRQTVVVQ